MKTLVVSYLPRGERSHTRKFLNAFVEATIAKAQDEARTVAKDWGLGAW